MLQDVLVNIPDLKIGNLSGRKKDPEGINKQAAGVASFDLVVEALKHSLAAYENAQHGLFGLYILTPSAHQPLEMSSLRYLTSVTHSAATTATCEPHRNVYLDDVILPSMPQLRSRHGDGERSEICGDLKLVCLFASSPPTRGFGWLPVNPWGPHPHRHRQWYAAYGVTQSSRRLRLQVGGMVLVERQMPVTVR